MADRFDRWTIPIKTSVPIVSFTFDDAPETAFREGGRILRWYGTSGTYFLSLGLLGTETEVGGIASLRDLEQALNDGHELGCHTFDHLDAWHTTSAEFMASIDRNRRALDELLPGTEFRTFAYPKSGPMLAVKGAIGEKFIGCRGGGQVANVGTADLNLLKACFLDVRTGINMDSVGRLIDSNAESRGWLIFATHDLREDHSVYGCTPAFFHATVDLAARSGALLLPLGKACQYLTTLAECADLKQEELP